MTRPHAPIVCMALVLSACGSDGPPFEQAVDVKQLMVSVIEPAAEVYWDAVGTIIDFNGTTDIRPASPEEWVAVRNAAVVIAESGNLLMMPSRARDQGSWMTYARALVAVGRDAIGAAEARNADAVFDAGAEVYLVCSECHASYALETLRPSDPRSN